MLCLFVTEWWQGEAKLWQCWLGRHRIAWRRCKGISSLLYSVVFCALLLAVCKVTVLVQWRFVSNQCIKPSSLTLGWQKLFCFFQSSIICRTSPAFGGRSHRNPIQSFDPKPHWGFPSPMHLTTPVPKSRIHARRSSNSDGYIGVGKKWKVHGTWRVYDGGLGAEPLEGSRGKASGGSQERSFRGFALWSWKLFSSQTRNEGQICQILDISDKKLSSG